MKFWRSRLLSSDCSAINRTGFAHRLRFHVMKASLMRSTPVKRCIVSAILCRDERGVHFQAVNGFHWREVCLSTSSAIGSVRCKGFRSAAPRCVRSLWRFFEWCYLLHQQQSMFYSHALRSRKELVQWMVMCNRRHKKDRSWQSSLQFESCLIRHDMRNRPSLFLSFLLHSFLSSFWSRTAIVVLSGRVYVVYTIP